MKHVKAFLEALSDRIPPDGEAHHHITLTECGLMLTLMIGNGRYLPVLLEEEDYDKPVDKLVSEIEEYVEDALR